MKKLTKEVFQYKSNLVHKEEYEILGIYVNSFTKILIRHKICGTEFYQMPNNHLMGKGCSNCNIIKLNKEILQNKSNNIYNNEYKIVGDYINNSTKISIMHNICKTEFEILPNSHLVGKGGCINCFKSIKKTKKEFQEKSDIIHNNEYQILGDYINCKTKIHIKHNICGNIFLQSYDKHINLKRKCLICFGNNGRLNKEILQNKSDILYNSEYSILGNYLNNNTKILVKHKICNNEYLQLPSNHLKRKCYFCYGTPLKTNEKFQEESNLIHNNEYLLISDYINCKNNVTLLHKICNRQFTQLAGTHLSGSKCIYCAMSKGEKTIETFLINNNVKFKTQKSFKGCKNINHLSFDFYLPDYNLCIEFNGKQHYQPINWFGGESSFINNLKRDNIKKEFCVKNKIELFIIKYDRYKDINNILLEKLNLYEKI